jgi:hypothetical protein
MDLEQPTQAVSESDQTRRQALERFGKYAAAASAFTVLLRPSDGSAASRKGGGKGSGRSKGKSRKSNGHY